MHDKEVVVSSRAVLLSIFVLTVCSLERARAQCASQQLIDDDALLGDNFGKCLDVDGDVMVIGAPRRDGARGLAYVFERDAGAWSRVAVLRPNGLEPDSYFGLAVAVSGQVVAVGAPGSLTVGTPKTGSVYVFESTGGTWPSDETQKLVASDGELLDAFGVSVAASGTVIAVGAWGDDDAGQNAGAVYFFDKGGAGWKEKTKFVGSNSAANFGVGIDVALDGDLALVGSVQRTAYVLERGAIWSEVRRLSRTNSGFGATVALSGEDAIVGAYADGTVNILGGAVFVYRETISGWTQVAKLRPSDATDSLLFGTSLAADGATVVVGADWNLAQGRSSAYLFERDAVSGAWPLTETRQLFEGGVVSADQFGMESVAVSGETIVVGAYEDDEVAFHAGAAYVFQANEIGASYCCPGELNSTLRPGRLAVLGSSKASDDDLALVATGLPKYVVGYALVGDGSMIVVPPGSAGPLCIAGGIQGVKRQLPGVGTGAAGVFLKVLGTRQVAGLPGGILPGTTWSFQVWYLDGMSGFRGNYSNAVSVTFD